MKLTEQQRAYMFEHWPRVCEIPWNKVDPERASAEKSPLAQMLAKYKKQARAAHPAAAARPAAAIAKKAPAKKALKAYPIALCENAAFCKKPAGGRLDAAGECPPDGESDGECVRVCD